MGTSGTSTTARRCATLAATAALALGLLALPAAGAGAGSATPEATRAAGARAPVDYRGVIGQLRREIPDYMAQGKAVGLTIALVDGTRTVWTHGFGYADRGKRRPVTGRTLFHIGSTSKTLTAAAVMQLVQRGLVDLDAPLARYIPGFRMRPRFGTDPVTVRSVMTHHSGIPGDFWNLAEFGTRPDPRMYQRVLRQVRTQLPTRRVGAAWAYSNVAITLLQGVIENVSGESFQQYTQRHLFAPMGMRSSTFDDAAPPSARMAANYQVVPADDGTVRVLRRPRDFVNIRPAGSVLSNAIDMAAYARTMIAFGRTPTGRRILAADTVRDMIRIQPASPWDRTFFRQGLVWWRGFGDPGLGRVVNHGGDTYFHHSMLAWLPTSHLGVFVSVNTAPQTNVTKAVWMRALALMLQAKTGRTPPEPPSPSPVVTPDPASLRALVGTYANSQGVVTVRRAGTGVALTPAAQLPDAQPELLTLRADGWYASDTTPVAYRSRVIGHTRVLLARSGTASGMYGQRIPATYRVPPAWARRVGSYRMAGIQPSSYPADPSGVEPRLTLRRRHGILLLGTQVLKPQSGRLAFSYGPSPLQVMRDAGFAAEVRGGRFTWMGLRLVDRRAVSDAPTAPPASAWAPDFSLAGPG